MVSMLLMLVVVLRILTFILGGLIAALAFRGYKRSKDRSMLYLAFGLGFITLGSFIEGALFEFGGFTNPAHAIESVLIVLGFLLVLYSIRRS